VFISRAELYYLRSEVKSLKGELLALREGLSENATRDYVTKWADAISADLSVEVALLAKALGYVLDRGAPHYRKMDEKSK
jgi:hypothetical protein